MEQIVTLFQLRECFLNKRLTMKRSCLIMGIGVSLLCLSLCGQTLINVDFAAYQTVKTGFAGTGLTPQDFWNNYTAPFQSFAALTNLKTSDGTQTATGLTVQNGAGHTA